MIKIISFKARILLNFLVIISLMIAIVTVGLFNFSQTQRDVVRVADTFLPNALSAERMAIYTLQVQQYFTQASLNQDTESFQDAKRAADDFKQSIALFRESLSKENSAENSAETTAKITAKTTESPAVKKGDITTLKNVASSAAKLKELAALEAGFD